MRARSLVHLSDGVLVSELKALLGRERAATASVIAHMAEVDARRLYAPAGYPSMHAWCVAELHLSEDAAYKRITTARAVRTFPALLTALADGRLHLSAIVLLAPHFTHENAGALIEGASGRSKREIEMFLAERFPRTEMLPIVQVLPPGAAAQLAPGRVHEMTRCEAPAGPPAAEAVEANTSGSAQLAPGRVGEPDMYFRVAPLAPGRFLFQLCVEEATHERLRHVQALLSHRIPSGDLIQVLDRVLEDAVQKYGKPKFAQTSNPRRDSTRPSTSKRHVPARVKRAVWERDQGHCTFVSASGQRCPARRLLEFDHVTPVAQGGKATVDGMRLRCRAHNQYEAERAFGAGFMHERREGARRAGRTKPAWRTPGRTKALQSQPAGDPDLMRCLRTLGFRAAEMRDAAAFCETRHTASLEERVKLALSWLRPKGRC